MEIILVFLCILAGIPLIATVVMLTIMLTIKLIKWLDEKLDIT